MEKRECTFADGGLSNMEIDGIIEMLSPYNGVFGDILMMLMGGLIGIQFDIVDTEGVFEASNSVTVPFYLIFGLLASMFVLYSTLRISEKCCRRSCIRGITRMQKYGMCYIITVALLSTACSCIYVITYQLDQNYYGTHKAIYKWDEWIKLVSGAVLYAFGFYKLLESIVTHNRVFHMRMSLKKGQLKKSRNENLYEDEDHIAGCCGCLEKFINWLYPRTKYFHSNINLIADVKIAGDKQ